VFSSILRWQGRDIVWVCYLDLGKRPGWGEDIWRRRRCRFRLCCQSTGVDLGMGKKLQLTTLGGMKIQWNPFTVLAIWGVYQYFDPSPCFAMLDLTDKDWKAILCGRQEMLQPNQLKQQSGSLSTCMARTLVHLPLGCFRGKHLLRGFLKWWYPKSSKLLDHFI